jgi:hypothetical protein
MAQMIKLSQWAENHGINYQTAYRWYKAGKLPAKNIVKTPTGTILVEELDAEYSSPECDEAIMTDETQPLSRRLSSAYRFIKSQQKEEPLITEELDPLATKWQDDISCVEKNQIINNLLWRNDAEEKIQKSKKELTVNEKLNLLNKEDMEMKEDISIIKKDLADLMSNVFGDGTVLIDRIRGRYLAEIDKILKLLLDNSNTIEDVLKKYEEYKKAATFRKI